MTIQRPMLTLFGEDHNLGFLPYIVHADDKRSAREQINERYAHGGGWRPMSGWRLQWVSHLEVEHALLIEYPGDEPMYPLAVFDMLSGERLFIYPHAWAALVAVDGEVEVARLD